MSQLQVTGEAKIRDIQGPVVANSGVITALDGAANQYVRGDGTLASFPTSGGGGSSVSYYLNGSVNQGTFAGSTYYEMSEDAIIGTGTNFSTSTNGLIAQFITDVNVPDVTQIPSGNWNVEFFMGVSASSGALASFYVEIYKWDGTTFTLIATNVATPEQLTNTTTVDAYFTSVAMPTTALSVTDRLAVRIFVNVAGKTVTLYTEDNRLCQIVTTFSKGVTSINNLTDQSQYLTTGTSGTNFNIVSSGDTHTFNLPVASATNTGKLSSTDWSTFNNKQNTITDPITGTGVSTGVAYFNSGTSITSEAAFNYDASTNRLGVNTSVPNATIGANAATDSGYSLLVKNDNTNYNGIGFATDSTYGNLISTEKLGTALTRNLTLLNQSGYISLTEAGNLGVNILSPNTGLDIYNGSNAYLWLHTANSGITGTDGVRLALFSTNGANLRNFDGSFSITAEGDFSVITLGAENFRVNSADGSIYQSKVANAMLKSVSGVITAAVANTDYQSPITLTTSGSSGAATFSSNTLNVPNYTLSGLGGVPTSRTLTINGTPFDLSADRSWSVGTITGSGTAGQVPYFSSSTGITSEAGFIYDASTNRLGVNTSVPNATIGGDAALDSGYGLLIKTGPSNYNGIGIAIDSTYGNLISTEKLGTASARNLTLLNQSGFVSLTESGNLGLNVLTPAVSGNGIDIYGSTSVGLRFHTATSGTTVSDGAGINFSAANNLGITNYENGTIDIVTNGNSGVFVASNGFVGINGATPSVALTVNGGAAISNLTTGQIVFPTSGGTLSGTNNLFWNNSTSQLGVGTNSPSAGVTSFSTNAATQFKAAGTAPAITFSDTLVSATYAAVYGLATGSNQFVTGTAAGDMAIANQSTVAGAIVFGTGTAERMRMSSSGDFGLGTSIPDTKLDVRGEISLSYSADNGLRFYNQDRSNWSSISNTIASPSSSANLVFRTGAGVALTIESNRNATFTTNITAQQGTFSSSAAQLLTIASTATNGSYLGFTNSGTLNGAIGNGSNIISGLSNSDLGIWTTGLIAFQANGSERMRITSGGNVGIGTSSPAQIIHAAASLPRIQVESTTNTNSAGINFKTKNSSGTIQAGGLYYVPGSTPYITLSGDDNNSHLNVTSAGNVGIGTSSPVFADGIGLQINNGAGSARLKLTNNTTGGTATDGAELALAGSDFYIGNNEAANFIFFTSLTERMRITSGGQVLVGKTTNSGRLAGPTVEAQGTFYSGGSQSGFFWEDRSTAANWYGWYATSNVIYLWNGSANAAQIIPSTGAYTALSDINKKKDFEASSIGLDAILGLKPTLYRMKTDDENAQKQLGFIAQEVKEFIPQAYIQTKGEKEDFIGLDDRPIIAALVKAIQEQTQIITNLEARIKQLENK